MLTGTSGAARPASAGRWSRLVVVLAGLVFVLVASVTQLLRQSGTPMWRTVWAEDGVEFYAGALDRPLLETVLESYAGYAHVAPRVLAWLGAQLPIEWYAVFASTSAAVVASLLALFVFHASAPIIGSVVKRAILSLALLYWPVLPFEVTGTITNIQWIMAMGCFLAVALPVERPTAIAIRALIVVFAPLTSPLCVLFLPIAAWQLVLALRSRKGRRFVVPSSYVLASGVQLVVWATAPQQPTADPGLLSFAWDVARLYGTRVTTELFLGVRVTEELWPRFGYWLAAASIVAVAVALAWRWRASTTAARWFICVCAVASVAVYAFSLWPRSHFLESMVIDPAGPYNFLSMRYQLLPAALLLLALLVRRDLTFDVFREPAAPDTVSLRRDVHEHRLAIGLAVVWLLVAFVPSFRLTTSRSAGPDWLSGVDAAQEGCIVGDALEAPVAVSPSPEWVVPVPCSALLGEEDGADR